MVTLLTVAALSVASYAGTMVDNFFAFVAQLTLTPADHRGAVSAAQSVGVGTLVIVALGLGNLLRLVPLSVFGLCALAPWALALHSARHRHDPRTSTRRGVIATFTATVALGGDNIAVWTPLLRAGGIAHALVVLVVFAVGQLGFVSLARLTAQHPRLVGFGERAGQWVLPAIYASLGVIILLETGVL